MANAKEIKTRIESVRDTSKITNAMYLISSTKMQKAKKSLERSRPYFDAMRKEIDRVFACAEDTGSRYFFSPDAKQTEKGRFACLVITADKGLAGNYNMNVIKETEKLLKNHPDARLYVIGDYGRHYFDRHKIAYEKSFDYTAQVPHLREARDIADILIESYDKKEIDRVYVIYTNMKTALSSEAEFIRILPLDRGEFIIRKKRKEAENLKHFEFFPSSSEVLDNAIRSLAAGFIYGALTYSFCSEQNARMNAMDSANKNAEKILAELKLEYNRVRQAAITQEITEISAGELAQKRKRLKNQTKEIETS